MCVWKCVLLSKNICCRNKKYCLSVKAFLSHPHGQNDINTWDWKPKPSLHCAPQRHHGIQGHSPELGLTEIIWAQVGGLLSYPSAPVDFSHQLSALGMIYWACTEICIVKTWLLSLFKEDWWKPGYTVLKELQSDVLISYTGRPSPKFAVWFGYSMFACQRILFSCEADGTGEWKQQTLVSGAAC